MGRINHLYRPAQWKKDRLLGHAKDNHEPVWLVTVGSGEDERAYEICVAMRESHYNNCVSGRWTVKTHPYSEHLLELYDILGNRIDDPNSELY